jgi:acetyl coenzyme A synthetase (ADP forming)-like protein
MGNSLEALFNPKGIVILGASSDPGKLGYAVARNLVQGGYPGAVHFVNPKGGRLFDRTLHHSVLDVPDPVDLAVVIVPAPAAPQALKDIGARGIRTAILTSGGFRETGEEGAALEEEVLLICRQNGIRLIGPNCIGLLDTHLPLDTTFLPPPPPQSGNIAFLSHSGAFCAAVIDWSRRQGFGFSRLVSLGNQADLTETDLLPAIADDPHTRSIALYLETIPDGIRFFEAARRITPEMPIVALKVGRTASGQKAAASHTGALAGTEAAVNASFEKAGIQRASTCEELFDWARALACFPLPAGRSVAILTNAGGPGVIAADALTDHRLMLASLSTDTITALQDRLPSAASAQNPVDMLASASPADYAACLSLLIDEAQVHAIFVIIPPSPVYPTHHIAKALIPLIKKTSKPVIPILMGSKLIHNTFQQFNRHNIPTYPFPERAASALARLADRADFLKEIEISVPPPPEFNDQAISEILSLIRRDAYDPDLGYRLMEAIGIQTVPVRLAGSQKEAEQISRELGFPLVAKIASPDILHKSDVGGVLLELDSPLEVNEAYGVLLERAREKQPTARIKGITLQRQIPPGQEVIFGVVRDPQFGALIMFGSGGIDVEGLKDIAFALAPLAPHEAEKLLQRTWAGRKLSGYRNLPPVDRAAVMDALVNLSWLAFNHPQITECEINPLRVLDKGAVAVDVRIKMRS